MRIYEQTKDMNRHFAIDIDQSNNDDVNRKIARISTMITIIKKNVNGEWLFIVMK